LQQYYPSRVPQHPSLNERACAEFLSLIRTQYVVLARVLSPPGIPELRGVPARIMMLVEFWCDAGGVRRMRRILVLTPSAGAFVRRAGVIIRSGLALADGTIRGSSSRLLAEFLQTLPRY
jgi:hypothetical protein